ncbi:hypothetical protein LSH36_37g12017 [Paralvinella palmiformis]|uniref:Secreted protein n=1 Tax=Paralvinella palmiformis TaxID=53620 RepID=A0AAD9K8I9_9ANNE|nr:hypothetical protein LSH36_37g12017 [Paralvinella palmiformis]
MNALVDIIFLCLIAVPSSSVNGRRTMTSRQSGLPSMRHSLQPDEPRFTNETHSVYGGQGTVALMFFFYFK